ncbi:nucleotidyltransferase family protein [Phormidium sp. CCY1219]|uniref:nucleotidyltransferase family protein n=1 Tax=Phormidium sp. CCY1219 TaxID=2886104 RepID=UPI002D1E5F26|nr:nucleotidyltransferase family protein [Phormidium sp. CCY1219]MEB3828482.1 nucleotidyltransferase family protein [Phormidium sp. CCY1219]
MKAILLAGGYGTRLRPLTNTIPKCLVPIKSKPLLEIWLERLTEAGIGPLLINTHYLADQVNDFIDRSPYQDQVTLVHEPALLGTAGTLMANLDFFQGEDGLIIHADNYCLADFTSFVAAHRQRPPECLLTLMTFRTDTPSTCGIVELNSQNIVVGFHEKVANPPGNLASGAICILSNKFLEWIKDNKENFYDFSKEVLPLFVNKVYAWETKNIFIDIGSREAYQKANAIPI